MTVLLTCLVVLSWLLEIVPSSCPSLGSPAFYSHAFVHLLPHVVQKRSCNAALLPGHVVAGNSALRCSQCSSSVGKNVDGGANRRKKPAFRARQYVDASLGKTAGGEVLEGSVGEAASSTFHTEGSNSNTAESGVSRRRLESLGGRLGGERLVARVMEVRGDRNETDLGIESEYLDVLAAIMIEREVAQGIGKEYSMERDLSDLAEMLKKGVLGRHIESDRSSSGYPHPSLTDLLRAIDFLHVIENGIQRSANLPPSDPLINKIDFLNIIPRNDSTSKRFSGNRTAAARKSDMERQESLEHFLEIIDFLGVLHHSGIIPNTTIRNSTALLVPVKPQQPSEQTPRSVIASSRPVFDHGRAIGGERLVEVIDFLGVLQSPAKVAVSLPPLSGEVQTTTLGNRGQRKISRVSDQSKNVNIQFEGGVSDKQTNPQTDAKSAPLDRNVSSQANGWNLSLNVSDQSAPLQRGSSQVRTQEIDGSKEKSWLRKEPRTKVMVQKDVGGGGALGGELLTDALSRFKKPFQFNAPVVIKAGKRAALPVDLMKIQDLDTLLKALQPLSNLSEKDNFIAPKDAVIALNHLKRLRRKAGGSAVCTEYDRVVDVFMDAAERGMFSLSPKQIALAINAIAGRERAGGLLQAASKRIIEMWEDPVVDYPMGPQSISMILNGYAKSSVRDVSLFECLSCAILSMASEPAGELIYTPLVEQAQRPEDKWNSQNIAIVLNAHVKVGISNPALFQHFSKLSLKLNEKDFTPQSVGNVLNACVRASIYDRPLYAHLCKVAKAFAPSSYNAQAVSNIVNACVRSEHRDEELFMVLSSVCQQIPARTLTAQSIANIANAYSRAGIREPALFCHLSAAAMDIPVRDFSLQSIELIMNAFGWFVGTADVEGVASSSRNLLAHLSVAAQQYSPSAWEVREIAVILNAIAKANVRDELLLDHLIAALLLKPAEAMCPQDIALSANALSRFDHGDTGVLRHLAQAARAAVESAAPFSSQSLSNALNAFAKLSYFDRELYQLLGGVLLDVPRHQFSFQQAGSILNAFARGGFREKKVIDTMCAVILELPGDGLDAQAVSNVVHALAMLDVRDELTIDKMCSSILTFNSSDFKPVGIANLAWGLAVTEVQSPRLDAWMDRAIAVHLDAMDCNLSRQILQYLIHRHLQSRSLSNNDSGKVETNVKNNMLDKVRKKAGDNGGATVSDFHRDVVQVLEANGIVCEIEHVDSFSGYSFDIWIPLRSVAVEVDGPYHFAVGTRTPLGSTVMKHRQARQLGIKLHTIPYWDWAKYQSFQEKSEYLDALLSEFGGSNATYPGSA